MRYTLIFLFSLNFSSFVYAQEIVLGDLHGERSIYLQTYIEEQAIPMDTPLSKLLISENDKLRSNLFGLTWGEIHSEQSPEKRVALTDLFVRGLKDEKVDYYVANRLRLPPFEKEYFSEEAKKIILDPKIGEIRYPFYIRILAVAEIDDPRVDLKTLSKQEKAFKSDDTNNIFEATQTEHFVFYASPAWAAAVVEARRGNREALERVLTDVRNAGTERMVARPEVVEDLGFIRQPETVDVLVDYLFNPPKEHPQFSGDMGILPLSYRAAKALSMCLVDYPFDYWGIYGPEQVEEAREFIRNYKGPWRIIGKWNPEDEVAAEADPEAEAVVPEEAVVIEETPPTAPEPTSIQLAPESEDAPWWPWVVGGVAVLALLAPLLLRRTRGNRE